MRLFVAAVPPPAAFADLDRALDPVRRLPGAPRWIAPELRHLTVAFFGDVGADRLSGLRTAMAAVAGRHAPFRLRLTGVGTFPPRGAPRVLWTGLADPPDRPGDPAGSGVDGPGTGGAGGGGVDRLVGLARDTARAARGARIAVERRPYRPHLTLGRWRPGDRSDLAVVAALTGYAGPPFPVAEIHLLCSHLGPAPRYEPLDSWPLTG